MGISVRALWQQTGNAADLAVVRAYEVTRRHAIYGLSAALRRLRALLRDRRNLGRSTARFALALALCALLLFGRATGRTLHRTAPQPPQVVSGLLHEEIRRLQILDAVRPGVVFVGGEHRETGQLSGGTGWVFDDHGHIVVCLSSIEATARGTLRVRFADQTSMPAQVLGVDRSSDLAVLELRVPSTSPQGSRAPRSQAGGFALPRALPLAAEGSLSVGQDVYVIGNPYGVDHTLTRGVVSGLGRSLALRGGLLVQGAIQTDAAVNAGNSGGPVLNSRGEVVGMATSATLPDEDGGLALPAKSVSTRAESILTHGRVRWPSLGLHLGPDGLAERLGARSNGAVVMEVVRGGPAWEAGVRAGDVLVAIGERPVQRVEDVVEALANCEPGDTLLVAVWRPSDGGASPSAAPYKEVQLSVRLGEDPG